jgi:phospholipid/cholesterol/gamma-HCH transport system permease protein
MHTITASNSEELLFGLEVSTENANRILRPTGAWCLENLDKLPTPTDVAPSPTLLDLSGLSRLDTCGAYRLLRFLPTEDLCQGRLRLHDGSQARRIMIELVAERAFCDRVAATGTPRSSALAHLGEWVSVNCLRSLGFINFLGELLSNLFSLSIKPLRFRQREFFSQLKHVLLEAIPIVVMMTALIGIVLAYLFSTQLEKYGANVFVADGVALAMCRELSPILVAIIMAGRSGSAFTAQLGTMKLNDEIDAITTMGLSVFRVLIVPRVLALMLAMPLLVFLGDLSGILGGMIIAEHYLGVTPTTYWNRVDVILTLRHIMAGLLKAPVFALFIGLIGCRMGLLTENNAQSLGLHTTATVVQSIVAVILLNAVFAVILVELRF